MMYSLLSDTCKWMSAIDDNKSLAHVSIPGTHDSCARIGAVSHTLSLDGLFATQYSDCTITKQLSDGVRFLDISCCVADNRIVVYHGYYYLQVDLERVLAECVIFLAENASEVIIIRIKRETTPVKRYEFQRVFTQRYAPYHSQMYLASTIPLVGEVRGKMVILSNMRILSGIPENLVKIHENFSQASATDKRDNILTFVQRAIKENRSNQPPMFFISYCNSISPPCLCPQEFAETFLGLMTQAFREGLQEERVDCRRYEAAHVGIITMDFYTKAMISEIIKRNENKNLIDFPIFTINNKSNGLHSFYASLYMDALMDSRRVFSWVPGDRLCNGYWMLVTHDRGKNEFYLLNTYYKEYLYASSQVKDNRRSVFTWVDGVLTPECIWTIKDSCIFNNFYQCFLYESRLCFNVDRQLTPCWVPGTRVKYDRWEFALVNGK